MYQLYTSQLCVAAIHKVNKDCYVTPLSYYDVSGLNTALIMKRFAELPDTEKPLIDVYVFGNHLVQMRLLSEEVALRWLKTDIGSRATVDQYRAHVYKMVGYGGYKKCP